LSVIYGYGNHSKPIVLPPLALSLTILLGIGTNLHSPLKHYHVTHQQSFAFIPENYGTMATTPRGQKHRQRGKRRKAEVGKQQQQLQRGQLCSFWVLPGAYLNLD